MIDLKESKEICEKATPGPWVVETDSERVIIDHESCRSYYIVPRHLVSPLGPEQEKTEAQCELDAAFCKHAILALPESLRLLEEARGIIETIAGPPCSKDNCKGPGCRAYRWLKQVKL